jgi:hypothetical protein
MWKIIRKIFISIICVGVIMAVILDGVTTLNKLSNTFRGEAKFSTIEEMQQYQSEVVAKVKEANGVVNSFDLTIQSPPKVKYELYIPNTTEFEYGKQVWSATYVMFFNLFMLIFGLWCGVREIRRYKR